jgi:hypothetical protein
MFTAIKLNLLGGFMIVWSHDSAYLVVCCLVLRVVNSFAHSSFQTCCPSGGRRVNGDNEGWQRDVTKKTATMLFFDKGIKRSPSPQVVLHSHFCALGLSHSNLRIMQSYLCPWSSAIALKASSWSTNETKANPLLLIGFFLSFGMSIAM